jgi:hypothetical protein
MDNDTQLQTEKWYHTLWTLYRTLCVFIVTAVILCVTLVTVGRAAEPTAELTTKAQHILWTELEANGVAKSQHNEVVCLAENIYFEARAESYSGKAAVGNVTRNRVEDSRWPSTYCAVVQQGPKRESWKTKQHKDLADADRVYYPVKHKGCHILLCTQSSVPTLGRLKAVHWCVGQPHLHEIIFSNHPTDHVI